MVLDNIKKTISIDLSPMPATLSRQDLVGLLLAKFEGVVVKAIQFIPVKTVHVTFEDVATRDNYALAENIVLDGFSCRVISLGLQARMVYIYHYPYEEDDNRLKVALGAFGKVLEVRHQSHVGFNSVSTGTRLIKMVRERPIRRNLTVGGYRVKAWYVGQPLECDICSGPHVSKDCPVRGKCRNCRQPGHKARECPNRPNAWGTVNQGADAVGASSASSDPAPAVATQAAGDGGSAEVPALSSSISSGVGADLVSGELFWESQLEPGDGELPPLSASDSDSSPGSHVSPSLSNGTADKDVNLNNDQCNDNSTGSSDVLSNSNSQCNESSVISSESNVSRVGDVPGSSAGGATGPTGAADVTMAEAPILGKRAISQVDISSDVGTASEGAASVPKKGSGKAASRSKKAASSVSARKTSHARCSR